MAIDQTTETKRLDGLKLVGITEPNSDERHLASLALDVQACQRDEARSVVERNRAMRSIRQGGSSLARISTLTGLSIAQVQRICDLSKDRSE